MRGRFSYWANQPVHVPRSLLVVWLLLALLAGMILHALDPDQLVITTNNPAAQEIPR